MNINFDIKHLPEDEVWIISNNKPKKMKIKEVMIISNNKFSKVLYSFYNDDRLPTAFLEENGLNIFDTEELTQKDIDKMNL